MKRCRNVCGVVNTSCACDTFKTVLLKPNVDT